MDEPSRKPGSRILRFGAFEFVSASLELSRAGRPVKLAPMPARLLALLAARGGELVTREELRAALWGDSTFVDFEGSLNFCVNQLRTALGDRADEPRFIETLRGRGYRFVAPVERSSVDRRATVSRPVPRGRSRHVTFFAALAAVLSVGSVLVARGDSRSPIPDGRGASLAVLPFQSAADDPNQRHLGRGISDAVASSLVKVDVVRVAPATSVRSMRLKGKEDLDIARSLGVHSILTGSIARSGERLTVTARLREGPSWHVTWQQQYDRPFDEFFDIRADIAQRIADTLDVSLSLEQRRLLAERPTRSAHAYDLLLRAAEYYRRQRAQDYDNAIALYRRAIEADPDFALAHGTLANALIQRWMHRRHQPELRGEALRSAQRALDLDPNVPQAYKALGMIYSTLGRLEESQQAYQRALELWPDFGAVVHNLGRLAVQRGEWSEALRWQRRMMRLFPHDPLSTSVLAETLLALGFQSEGEEWMARVADEEPRYVVMHLILARHELRGGDRDAARARMGTLLETDPGNSHVQTLAGHYALAVGDDESAEAHFRRVLELSAGVDAYARFRVASIGWRNGDRSSEVERTLKEFSDTCQQAIDEGFEGQTRPLGVALAAGVLGEREVALDWLERAFAAGRLDYRWDLLDPAFESLRDEPRFQRLMERMQGRIASMHAEALAPARAADAGFAPPTGE